MKWSLFSSLRKKKTNKEIIGEWLMTIDRENELPEEIVALNFGLYEPFGKMDLIGSENYDANDDDWACDEDWVPDQRFCPTLSISSDKAWDEVLVEIKKCLEDLVHDCPDLKLWKVPHITIGFDDGDLTVIDH